MTVQTGRTAFPAEEHPFDVVVVGAGITGAALARELAAYDLRIALLDRGADVPAGASRANSAMLHAGYSDPPGSLRARLCAAGNRRYRVLAEELDIPLRACGSHVVAFTAEDQSHLEALRDQGLRNGVPGLRIVSGDELRQREPGASPHAVGALFAPTGAVISNFEAVRALLENAQANGVEFFPETEARRLVPSGAGEGPCRIRGVETSRGFFRAPVVLNAAGGGASALAEGEALRVRPTRGEYVLGDKIFGDQVRGFLFPCPDERGKGIAVTRTVEGNLLLGPTSETQDDPDDTATTAEGLAMVWRGASRLVPSLPSNLAITVFSGVRANDASGDFRIFPSRRLRGVVHVAGIRSPGFTSAPAVALYVVELLREELGDLLRLTPRSTFSPERRGIPRFGEMSREERRALVAENPAYGQIVCRCEMITEAQVVEAIRRGARTVAGVKMAVRAGSGRCQGSFCLPRVVALLARELGVSPEEVTRHGGTSRILAGPAKGSWGARTENGGPASGEDHGA